jgi:hypothetical protein
MTYEHLPDGGGRGRTGRTGPKDRRPKPEGRRKAEIRGPIAVAASRGREERDYEPRITRITRITEGNGVLSAVAAGLRHAAQGFQVEGLV